MTSTTVMVFIFLVIVVAFWVNRVRVARSPEKALQSINGAMVAHNRVDHCRYPSDWGERFDMEQLRQRVETMRGGSISVQARDGAYCSPRQNYSPFYASAELGFPDSMLFPEGFVEEWVEMSGFSDNIDPERSVYPYVPTEEIINLLLLNGGVREGELPPLV